MPMYGSENVSGLTQPPLSARAYSTGDGEADRPPGPQKDVGASTGAWCWYPALEARRYYPRSYPAWHISG